MILSIKYKNDVLKMFSLKDTKVNLNEIKKVAEQLYGVEFVNNSLICKNKIATDLIYGFYRNKVMG